MDMESMMDAMRKLGVTVKGRADRAVTGLVSKFDVRYGYTVRLTLVTVELDDLTGTPQQLWLVQAMPDDEEAREGGAFIMQRWYDMHDEKGALSMFVETARMLKTFTGPERD